VLTTQSNALSYVWHPGITLNDSTLKNPIAKPTTTTKYYIIGTLGGCSTIDSVTVTVNPAPIPDAGIDKEICFGITYTLQGSGGTQYTWAPVATLNNANSSNPVANTPNTTLYWLKVQDANGCNSLIADTMKLTVTPPLQADAGVDTTIVVSQPYQLNSFLVGQNISGLSYQWNPTIGLNNPNIQNPLATISAATTYVVRITTPGGCVGVDTVKLSVLAGPTIYVPSGFTPNGDGRNDLFISYPVGIARFDYLRVFNRWGQLVFESKNPLQGWDGKFKGKQVPSGTYIYTVQGLTDKGNLITKKGTIIIIQ
jgi:gliding motility-associated-like protein